MRKRSLLSEQTSYTLDDGPSYFIKGPVKVANGLTGINNAMVKRHFS